MLSLCTPKGVYRLLCGWKKIETEETGRSRACLNGAVVAEGVVAALVSDDPHTSGVGAVDDGVGDPEGQIGELHGDEGGGEDASGGCDSEGDSGVEQALGGIALEAVLGNRGQNLRLGGQLAGARNEERLAIEAGQQQVGVLFGDGRPRGRASSGAPEACDWEIV